MLQRLVGYLYLYQDLDSGIIIATFVESHKPFIFNPYSQKSLFDPTHTPSVFVQLWLPQFGGEAQGIFSRKISTKRTTVLYLVWDK